ncbi:MAG: A/G-specific adenine glycosylase [Planctomycetales bacterium]|nr:A/G-specific adenine glycosylase [Planctomycetales bacterium]
MTKFIDMATTLSVRSFRTALLRWFAKHQRDLPWRHTHDPYAIWISETMLQQTQVATVRSYYERFLERFPNVWQLADAEEAEVLRLWAGLGYYRRARQLHAAAKQICDQHEGQFPPELEKLQHLPGIGRYTAGAILSFAYDAPAPIVEANTSRVYCRLLALTAPPSQAATQKELWTFAESLQPTSGGSGALNQALMELGSLVCTPQAPQCADCPVKKYCRAYAAGLENEVPCRPAKQKFTALHHALIIVQKQKDFLVRRNPAGGWWEGLWDFPRVDITETMTALVSKKTPTERILVETCQAAFQAKFDLHLDSISHVHTLRHGVTRYRIRLDCFRATSLRLKKLPNEFQWLPLPAIELLGLTSTGRKMLRWISAQDFS